MACPFVIICTLIHWNVEILMEREILIMSMVFTLWPDKKKRTQTTTYHYILDGGHCVCEVFWSVFLTICPDLTLVSSARRAWVPLRLGQCSVHILPVLVWVSSPNTCMLVLYVNSPVCAFELELVPGGCTVAAHCSSVMDYMQRTMLYDCMWQ